MNHTSFYGKCEELASNCALCRQSADDGKNRNYKTANPRKLLLSYSANVSFRPEGTRRCLAASNHRRKMIRNEKALEKTRKAKVHPSTD